ncbi:MAG: LuxR C-terminal-related transcriptional regulator [Sedimentisphaerales bacterium]|nr:LuxR C-terminal-related transcriptional regulator [Sedimentisphaerales bacterium]
MAEQPKINEKRIAELVSDQKTASGVPRRPSGSEYCFTANTKKRPQADRYLENTLENNIEISESLTKREAQILRSILAGKTNKQIALMLSRSLRTIEYHRNRLMRKLDARNTVELVKRAVAMGIA